MIKQQENKNASYLEILNVANNNSSVWSESDLEAFIDGISALTTVQAAISSQAAIQKQNITGVTQDANEEKLTLITFLLNVSRACQAFGRKQNDNELYKKMHFTPSSLKRMRNSSISGTAQLVHDTASQLGAALLPFGITAAVLTSFQTLIDGYKNNFVTASNEAIKDRKNITVNSLPQLFKQADTIVRDQLLKLVGQFYSAHPDFVNKFISATYIGKAGLRHTRLSATIQVVSDASPTPAPAQRAFIIIDGLNGMTDEKGKCTITKVPDTATSAMITYKGATQTINNLVFHRGKATYITVTFQEQFNVPAPQEAPQKQNA